jgi:peptidoglycan hydrolase CwlO-like protein
MEILNDEKSQKSIKEIILVFSDIDVKITALNECSAEDFLALNTNLKKFYKDAKVISDQTGQIYDIIAGNEHQKFFEELLGLQESLNKRINMLKNKILKSIRGLEKMLTSLNLVFVPLKNFNLNILTLNFLLVNLKLNIAYSDNEVVKPLAEIIDSVTNEINKLKIILPKISESLTMVKNVTRLSSGKLIEIRKKNILDIDRVTGQINDSVIMLKDKQAVAAKKMPELTKRTESYFDSVNKIIMNLQYHDIIRQKMEHVQATHKNIIKELSTMDLTTNSDGTIDMSETAKQFLQIRDIAGVQVAQLINTNKEYQKAFAVIMRKFWDISEDMSVISQLCNEFVGNNDLTDSYYKDVQDRLRGTTTVLKRLITANEDFGDEIDTINQTIDEKHDKIDEIKSVYGNINDKIENILSTIASQSDTGLDRITEEVRQIVDTILENMNDVVLFFSQAQNISKKLQEINHEDSGNEISNNLKELNNKISELLASIEDHNEKIEAILTNNSKLSLNLSSEIKSSVEQVKYYDFFEKIMLEIVSQLNTIYSKLDNNTLNMIKSNKAENLKSLEERYTMESERIIHQQIINESADMEMPPQEDDNDVEFF